MECALKSSLIKPTMSVKATQQQQQQTAAALLMEEEIWKTAPQNGVAVDDFFVDDLLDFSKAAEEEIPEDNQQQQQTLPLKTDAHKNPIFQLQPNDPNTHHDLYVPADDVADLEWLSHFVDDSASDYSLTLPPAKLGFQNKPTHKRPIFTTPVQTKARTKRAARTGHRVWSNSLTDSSSSSSTSSSSPAAANPWTELTQSAESPAAKKKVKKQAKDVGAVVSGGPRRCSHCLVQKTPQWRSGPLGAKTLCNACGVRYKSGRLLPEYRPACSPTYSSEIHSNNHRKVMEMRRKKEGFGSPVVESF